MSSVVMQVPVLFQCTPRVPQMPYDRTCVEVLFHHMIWRNEVLVENSLHVKEEYQHVLDVAFDLPQSSIAVRLD